MIKYISLFASEYSLAIRTIASRRHPLCQQLSAGKISCLLLQISELLYKSDAAFINPDLKNDV